MPSLRVSLVTAADCIDGLRNLVISSLLLMIGNILSDICVALVDPRVQFK